MHTKVSELLGDGWVRASLGAVVAPWTPLGLWKRTKCVYRGHAGGLIGKRTKAVFRKRGQ